MRHRFRIIDFTIVIMAVLGGVYVALALDIFTNYTNHTPEALALEIDELIALSGIFLIGLIWALNRLRRERRENARRARAEREIRQLAFHDPLTGLPNRRQFAEALQAAVDAPPRSGASHGVFMIDLNGFKRVNDVFGHAAGDEVLLQVGGRITKAVRENDMVARLGGDEFAVLSTHISGPEAATGLAIRIIEELRQPIIASRGEHIIGAGIGIALAPQDGNDPAELLRKADIALYRAKSQSESAFHFFEEAMDAHVQERDGIERALRQAIEEGEIEPLYQPLADLKTGKVRGFEVRPRWVHPAMGAIDAERFIPIAEDSGLIGALTDLLLTRACADALNWPDNAELAFSISPVLLRDPGLGLRIIALLAKSGFSPRRLEIEITESALVRDMGAVQAALTSLRDSGIHITLNDFGTGYSSLYHLRNFKIDRIKIDRSFISAMTVDTDSSAIVKALVGLGTGLGLEVTAEGVETEDQRRILSAQGCQQGQGVFYGGAVEASAAASMLEGAVTRQKQV